MSTFYAKSSKVDAVQWFKEGDHPDVYMLGGDPYFKTENSVVPQDVNPGDWIVTPPNGRSMLCSHEEFNEAYGQESDSIKAFANHVRDVSSEFSSVHGKRLIVVDESKLKAFLQATE
ncbi:MAG: hypothetical protein P4L67_05195 [Candidatus Pacebacteria bacterium]|nr:hypothetical protein [Candidatus Paceibacterota bacterium]